jgi:hypothetical protein
MTHKYRVIWRHNALEAWQTEYFTTNREACLFKRGKRCKFRHAFVQVWQEREQQWV